MTRKLSVFLAVFVLTLTSAGQLQTAKATTPAAWKNAELGQQINTDGQSVLSAIAACDEAAYNAAMEKLRLHEKTLNAASKPWAKAMGGSMTPEDAAADKEQIKSLRNTYQSQWAAKQPCNTPVKEAKAENAPAGDTKIASQIFVSFAQEKSNAIALAKEGITACDRNKFLEGMDWLDEMAEDARSPGEEMEIDIAMDDLERQWRDTGNQKTCYGLAYPTPLEFALGADVGISHFRSHIGYLGSETGGGGNRILGQIRPNSTGTYAGLNFGTRIAMASMFKNMLFWGTPNAPNFSPYRFWDFFFAMSRAKTGLNDNIGTFDPGAGRDILFPGTGVGPNASGFNGGNNPALNVVYNATYAWAAYQMGFGHMMMLPNSRFKIRPYGGLEYKRLRTDEELSGMILGNQFSYQTNVRQHTIAPFVGVETAYRPASLANILNVPVEIGSDLRLNYDFNNASGSDFLALGANPTAAARLNNDDSSHSIKAKLDLTFNPDAAFRVGLGAAWERTSVPMIGSRDGTGPSTLDREDVDNATFVLRLKWNLHLPNIANAGF